MRASAASRRRSRSVMLRRCDADGLRSGNRGATILFVALILLPVTFFMGGMSVDITRIIIAAQQVRNAGDAAALAGAFQFKPGEADLDVRNPDPRRNPREVTVAVYRAAEAAQVTPLVTTPARLSTEVTPRRVELTVEYEVRGLVFTRLLQLGQADPEEDFRQGRFDYRTVRAADVCVPGEYVPTEGNCSRPPGG